jgi:NTP pyrophosphatase (non-canonical NTP hydrolase)
MEVKEYIRIIEKTAVFPREVTSFGIGYCWLGIQDELREFFEKIDNHEWDGLDGEKGDVTWYICALCQETGLSFEELITPLIEYYQKEDWKKITRESIFMSIATFSGNIKKFYRDGKRLNEIILKDLLFDILNIIYYHNTAEEILSILEQNYSKLLARRATNTLHGDGDYREKK